MQMNKPTLFRRITLLSSVFLLFASVLLLLGPLRAQDKPGADTQPAATANQAGPTTAEAATDKPGAGQPAEPVPPASVAPARTIKEFKPTEKIGADSAVSFPVDI
jgi:hypothetical protein